MRFLLLTVMMLSHSQAMGAVSVPGFSNFTELPSGQVIVSISGPAAERLYEKLSSAVVQETVGYGDEYDRSTQRVGRNLSCSRFEKNGVVIRHYCTTGEIREDGLIGAGAAG